MQNYLYTPPFDTLTHSERKTLAKQSVIVYLTKDSSLPTNWQGDFFVILKGKIKEMQGDELIAGLQANDWFDTKNKTSTFVSSEETLLLKINGIALSDITLHNNTLKELLFADIATRLHNHKLQRATLIGQNLLHSPIMSLKDHIKPPCFVKENDTLYTAVCTMNAIHAKHVLVQGDKVAMLTQVDICRAIADRADFDTVPVSAYATYPLQTIAPNDDVGNALLTMIDGHIHRLPIVDNGQIIGVLGQTELLSYLANHSNLITLTIKKAKDLDDIQHAVALIGKFIASQYYSGTKTALIARIVQQLNRQIFTKVWQLIAPAEVIDNTCVIVMGSEGRGEQIMRTDQDNALIIRDGFDRPNIVDYACAFNDTLNTLGYPYCTGGIMMSEPLWRQPLTAFKSNISNWLTGTADEMIWLATLLDGAYVCGDKTLFDELQLHLLGSYQTMASSNFINRFAKAITLFGDGNAFWQKFTTGSDSDIDLKKAGIFPIVHGVRTMALEQGIKNTNTKARLEALVNLNILPKNTAQELGEALSFFLTKRLAVSLITPDKSQRRVDPNTLSALDKDLLKHSLAIVKSFKSLIIHRYRLDVF